MKNKNILLEKRAPMVATGVAIFLAIVKIFV
jgi:hypothetical protein